MASHPPIIVVGGLLINRNPLKLVWDLPLLLEQIQLDQWMKLKGGRV